MKINIVIVFNHPYEPNIEILQSYYASKFSSVFFLSPFYNGDSDNVIPIYRGSFDHASFICDTIRFPEISNCDYMLITHDDVLINPVINQNNLFEKLNLSESVDGFVPHIRKLSENIAGWDWTAGSLLKLLDSKNPIFGTGHPGARYAEELINGSSAAKKNWLKICGQFGKTEYFLQGDTGRKTSGCFALRGQAHPLSALLAESATDYLMGSQGRERRAIQIGFPLLTSGSMADFVLLSSSVYKKYLHAVGVFNALGLFTEISTAMALACSCENLESLSNHKELYRWVNGSQGRLYEDTANIINAFDSGAIAVHPVKLSKNNPIKMLS
jgi:hypothetical protein